MPTTRIRAIHSRQNSRVKELRAALHKPGEYIALEGEHLLIEALRSRLQLQTIFVAAGFEDRLDRLALPEDAEILSLPADLFASVMSTETPQPLAALSRPPVFLLEDVLGKNTPLIVVAAGLQDPGNLGTLIRSAEAFGATGIIVLPGTTSQWNPKALRASSGSAFRLPVVHCSRDEMVAFLRRHGIHLFAAVVDSEAGVKAAVIGNLRIACAIVIGNEGAGLPPDLLALADQRIAIPHFGITESLNAAVAGSVLLYEAARQRAIP